MNSQELVVSGDRDSDQRLYHLEYIVDELKVYKEQPVFARASEPIDGRRNSSTEPATCYLQRCRIISCWYKLSPAAFQGSTNINACEYQ